MAVLARPTEPVQNRLLAALPRDEYERLLPSLQQVSFSLGEVVYEFGGRLDYVFFPTTSIVSLLYTMTNGATAEMGLTGNDGVVGIALFMGGGTMPNRAVVQSAGDAIRLKAKVLQEEFALGGDFQRLLLRYTQALITQISQTAVCNRLHSVEQQLCRWLLLSRDHLHTDEVDYDSGIDRRHAGRAPRRGYGGCGSPSGCRSNQLCAWPHTDPGPPEVGRNRMRVLSSCQRGVRSLTWITEVLLTAVHQWLTSSIYSQRCYHRGVTVFSFHPFLRSQHTTDRFFRKTQDNASVLKKHFEPRSSGCLRKIDGAECKPRNEVKDPRTDRGVAHRLNRFCIACSIVGTGPCIMKL